MCAAANPDIYPDRNPDKAGHSSDCLCPETRTNGGIYISDISSVVRGAEAGHFGANSLPHFPDGFEIEYKGQVYRPIGVTDWTRRDGSQTRLIEWSTICPDCQRPFSLLAGLMFKHPKRRCEACRVGKRGRQVGTVKSRRS